jgi:probable lipoprotein LpqN
VPELEKPLREMGSRLFQVLFAGPIETTYRSSLAVARERGERLRIVLRITAPELAVMPWETKLTGNVDPAKILQFAPGEIKNLPGCEGRPGESSKLDGFDAFQIGGTYTKYGVKRAIGQKIVVIPGQDGLYVLQLNADGLADHMELLMEATTVIDEQTIITR